MQAVLGPCEWVTNDWGRMEERITIAGMEIAPFSAFRYDPIRVSVGDVVTQPYDKISPEMQARYYQASPFNLVRIILGDPDLEKPDVYQAAAAHFRRLARAGRAPS